MLEKNPNPSVAVLLPCYNEEVTIGKVVRDFKTALPQADIYVYDNNSTDRTAEIAASEGAIVRKEPRQGKGNVISTLTCTSCLTATIRIQLTQHLLWSTRFLKATTW